MAQAFDFFGRRQAFRQLVFPTVSIGLVVVLTLVVLIPQVQGLIEDFRVEEEMREKLVLLQTKVAVLGSFDAAMLRGRTERINQALPSSEELGYFIGSLRQVALRSGVIFAGVEVLGQPTRTVMEKQLSQTVGRTKKVTLEKNEEATEMLVTVIGDLAKAGAFISEMQKSLPVVTIADFTSVREEGAAELTSRMKVTYYYAPPPETIGAGETPIKEITAAEEQTYTALTSLTVPEVEVSPLVPTGKTDFMSL
ncbi:MAG: hypothetical protein HYS86_02140 [Candidatus Chisholmbacteria bacterium]|nr:hypothetical protein [Candidatus Chisholmbacteria bacterium]